MVKDHSDPMNRFSLIVLSVLLLSGLLALNVYHFGVGTELIFWELLTVVLFAAALCDLVSRLIPLLLLLALPVLVGLSSWFFSLPLPLPEAASGAMMVGGVVAIIYAVTMGKGIGEADIFLGVVIGALFGWVKGLLVFSVANVLGLLVVLPLMAILGKQRMKLIPLVSFLVAAIFLEWYFGYTDFILHWLALS